MHHNHDTLEGYVAISIMDRLSQTLTPIEENLTGMVVKLDSVITSINNLLSPQMTADISSAVSNVNGITANLREISDKEKDELMASIEDLKEFTAMLSSNSSTLDASIKNLAAITDTVASADLSSSLASLKTSLLHVSELVDGMSKGQGSVGKLMTNDSLYTNLNNTLYNLDLLLQDMQANPKKYVHFSLFGKKDK
jgi:phospholipid/cholesterol/gamma-HCH transport system substrate-binding protein